MSRKSPKYNANIVTSLEAEFRSAFEGVVTLSAFTREIGKLLNLMGFADFSVLGWAMSTRYTQGSSCHGNFTRTLIGNSPESTVKKAVNYLVDVGEGQASRGLLKVYYEETMSPVDSPESGVRRGCYILIAKSGNYGYFIRKGGQASSCQQLLCVIDKSKSPDKFKLQVERNLLALDIVNRVVQEIGLDRFPGIFSLGDKDKKKIGSKPLHLLNIIATDDVTLGQAAEILCISVDTANKHIAKIKSELGVSTLPAAVFYAANKGLIDRII